jgi:hypothetical protein
MTRRFAVMDLGAWLRSLSLERYEAAFRENEIDETVLPNLTAEDLKDLGVSIVGTCASSSAPLQTRVGIATGLVVRRLNRARRLPPPPVEPRLGQRNGMAQ